MVCGFDAAPRKGWLYFSRSLHPMVDLAFSGLSIINLIQKAVMILLSTCLSSTFRLPHTSSGTKVLPGSAEPLPHRIDLGDQPFTADSQNLVAGRIHHLARAAPAVRNRFPELD
ncbi:hypothetical protein BH23GEM6_BH23GEM6_23970 [soil metagenome]